MQRLRHVQPEDRVVIDKILHDEAKAALEREKGVPTAQNQQIQQLFAAAAASMLLQQQQKQQQQQQLQQQQQIGGPGSMASLPASVLAGLTQQAAAASRNAGTAAAAGAGSMSTMPVLTPQQLADFAASHQDGRLGIPISAAMLPTQPTAPSPPPT